MARLPTGYHNLIALQLPRKWLGYLPAITISQPSNYQGNGQATYRLSQSHSPPSTKEMARPPTGYHNLIALQLPRKWLGHLPAITISQPSNYQGNGQATYRLSQSHSPPTTKEMARLPTSYHNLIALQLPRKWLGYLPAITISQPSNYQGNGQATYRLSQSHSPPSTKEMARLPTGYHNLIALQLPRKWLGYLPAITISQPSNYQGNGQATYRLSQSHSPPTTKEMARLPTGYHNLIALQLPRKWLGYLPATTISQPSNYQGNGQATYRLSQSHSPPTTKEMARLPTGYHNLIALQLPRKWLGYLPAITISQPSNYPGNGQATYRLSQSHSPPTTKEMARLPTGYHNLIALQLPRKWLGYLPAITISQPSNYQGNGQATYRLSQSHSPPTTKEMARLPTGYHNLIALQLPRKWLGYLPAITISQPSNYQGNGQATYRLSQSHSPPTTKEMARLPTGYHNLIALQLPRKWLGYLPAITISQPSNYQGNGQATYRLSQSHSPPTTQEMARLPTGYHNLIALQLPRKWLGYLPAITISQPSNYQGNGQATYRLSQSHSPPTTKEMARLPTGYHNLIALQLPRKWLGYLPAITISQPSNYQGNGQATYRLSQSHSPATCSCTGGSPC